MSELTIIDTNKELNGLKMGVIDLYRQYCPEKDFDDREFLIKQKTAHKPKFSYVKSDDTSENFNNNPQSLHEDSKDFEFKKSNKNVRFSIRRDPSLSPISEEDALKQLLNASTYKNKPISNSESKNLVSDEEVAEHKRKRLAEEAEARTASTYQKLEMLPTIQTPKTTSRNKLAEERSKDYSLFNRIGLWVDKILGKARPKTIQYTGAFNEIPLAPTFSEMLLNLISEKNLDNSEVYKKAQIDRRLFSKIISNQFYSPSRETVFCLIMALKLDMEEANDFMATAGFAFRRNNLTDVVVEYFIRTNNYDLFQLNEVLVSLNQDSLTD